jgi:hypothetical protein
MEKLKGCMFYHFNLLSTKQSAKHIIYLISKKNHTKSNYIFPNFVQRNLPLSSHNMNIKSVRGLCVASHCVFFKITNARIRHEREAPESAVPDFVRSVQSCQGRPCRKPRIMPIITLTRQKTIRILPASSVGRCVFSYVDIHSLQEFAAAVNTAVRGRPHPESY